MLALGGGLEILLPHLLDERGHLALETLQLRGDDQDVGEHADEDDQVGRRRVLLGRRHSTRSRSLMSPVEQLPIKPAFGWTLMPEAPVAREASCRAACPRARSGRASRRGTPSRASTRRTSGTASGSSAARAG